MAQTWVVGEGATGCLLENLAPSLHQTLEERHCVPLEREKDSLDLVVA